MRQHIKYIFILVSLLSGTSAISDDKIKYTVKKSDYMHLDFKVTSDWCEISHSYGNAEFEDKFQIGNGVFEHTKYYTNCSIRIPRSEFFEKFEFCSLSGIHVKGVGEDGRNTCHFYQDDLEGNAIFRSSSWSRYSMPSCEFICKVKN